MISFFWRWKTVLLFSLFCWLAFTLSLALECWRRGTDRQTDRWTAFTLSLAFIQPDAHSCLVGHVVKNRTIVVLAQVYTDTVC